MSSRRPLDHQIEPLAPVATGAERTEAAPALMLVRSLDDPDWRVRREAALKLGDCDDPRATHLVLEAMRNNHRNLRVLNGAIRALARNGVDVVTPLAGFLEDPDPQLRIAATLTLGERQDPRAIPAVLRALDDSDGNVRYHAIEALGKLGADEAVDSLVAIARSGQFEIAAPALDALGAIGDCRIAGELAPLLKDELLQLSAVEALGRLGDETTAKMLVPLLSASDDLRGAAARALVGIWQRFDKSYRRGDLIIDLVTSSISTAGIESIIDLTSRLESRARESTPRLESTSGANVADLPALVVVLGWIQHPRAESILIDCLDVPAAREAAISAISAKGARMGDLVAARLSAPDPETKAAALTLLGRIGNGSHVREMATVMDFEPELAVATIEALEKIDDRTAFEALVACLEDADVPVRQAAIAAIQKMKRAPLAGAIPLLLVSDNPRIRAAAVSIAANSEITGSELIPADRLLECCSDKDEFVRCAAFEALGLAGDRRVLPFLSSAMQTSSAVLRVSAVQAVAGLDSPDTWPLLQYALGDADSWVRYFAARSAGTRRMVDAIAPLMRIAEFDDAIPVRVAAVDAIAQIAVDRAVPLLIQLAAAEDLDLKHAALSALANSADRSSPLKKGTVPVGGSDPSQQSHSSERDSPLFQQAATVTAVLVAASRADELSTRLAGIRALGAGTQAQSAEQLGQIAREDIEGAAMQAAIDALEQSPAPEAGEVLLSLTAYPRCREMCQAALARLDASRLDDVAGGLRHDLVGVRRAAVEALSRHADRRALSYLKLSLDDPNPSVRQAAAKSLAVSLAPRIRETEP